MVGVVDSTWEVGVFDNAWEILEVGVDDRVLEVWEVRIVAFAMGVDDDSISSVVVVEVFTIRTISYNNSKKNGSFIMRIVVKNLTGAIVTQENLHTFRPLLYALSTHV